MADEAFALSPIAARAAQPSEADYEAIKDAFMETSRGRWFLTEYARRNRNADTRMVLDAVARIEGALAQQKAASGVEPAETLAKIAMLIEAGRTQVATELDRLSVEQTLAPSYKDVQTIRQIVWTLRECGTDLRMCDLFDAQAKAIETSLDILTSAAPRQAVLAVFDDLLRELNELAGDAAPASQAAADEATPAPETATAGQAPLARPSEIPAVSPIFDAGVSTMVSADQGGLKPSSLTETQAFQDVPAHAAAEIPADDPAPSQAEIAHDEAVLELIASEMAAPDPDELEQSPEAGAFRPPASETPTQPAAEIPAATGMSSIETPFARPSLGTAALASGAVRRQSPSFRSRFAAIQRMTQAEKVALFS